MVRRHANFVSLFDAGFVWVAFQSKQVFAILQKNLRTFELPADFDHVWEWHTGGKVETDKFDNQPLNG
jgi:hypothetical protein